MQRSNLSDLVGRRSAINERKEIPIVATINASNAGKGFDGSASERAWGYNGQSQSESSISVTVEDLGRGR